MIFDKKSQVYAVNLNEQNGAKSDEDGLHDRNEANTQTNLIKWNTDGSIILPIYNEVLICSKNSIQSLFRKTTLF